MKQIRTVGDAIRAKGGRMPIARKIAAEFCERHGVPMPSEKELTEFQESLERQLRRVVNPRPAGRHRLPSLRQQAEQIRTDPQRRVLVEDAKILATALTRAFRAGEATERELIEFMQVGPVRGRALLHGDRSTKGLWHWRSSRHLRAFLVAHRLGWRLKLVQKVLGALRRERESID